jgi:hypothetical protein
MIEKIIAAIAAISAIALAGHGREPVPNPRKISAKTMTSLVRMYFPYTFTARFWTAADKPLFEKNVPPCLFYIRGKDNSSVRDMRGVMTL